MSNNTVLPTGAGGDTIRDLDRGGVKTGITLIDVGGTASEKLLGDANNFLPDNVAQFGGSAVVTGTGVGGAGIPRVTVSSDSSLTANVGTTNGLALDASVNGLLLTQGSSTTSEKGPLVQAAVTTSAPTYTTGNTNPLSLTTAGALRVDGSGVTQPVSGTVTTTPPANASTNVTQVAGNNVGTAAAGVMKVGIVGNANGALDAAGQNAASPANELLVAGQFNTSPTAITSGNVSPLQLDANANLLVNVKTGVVTANAGTNLNTSALALESGGNLATLGALAASQEATTSGLKGIEVFGAVTTSAPTYTTGKSDALSLTTAGALRVDGSGVTQPVSGTVTTTPPSNASTNVAQFGGTNVNTGVGASGAGTPRVTVANDSFQSSTSSAPAQSTVGTTAAQALASNVNRREVILQNTGTTVLRLSLGGTNPTQTAYHIALKACTALDDGTGGTFISDKWTGAIQIISSAASGQYVVTELT